MPGTATTSHRSGPPPACCRRSARSRRAPRARFLTWCEISSNLPALPRCSDAPLDIAFLPGPIAQHAGVPLDDLLAANVTARELCGGLLYECRDPKVRNAYQSYVWNDLKAFKLP